ncbi:MAG: hypothetical protein LBD23_18700 [Oscillospiraceae bacterium]|jgi:hypothetical protein|nr:hypothetical protein [Oscillospiraceae bacterium]
MTKALTMENHGLMEMTHEEMMEIDGGSWLGNFFTGVAVVFGIVAVACGILALPKAAVVATAITSVAALGGWIFS